MEEKVVNDEYCSMTVDFYSEKIKEVSDKVKKQNGDISSIFCQLSSLENQFDKYLVEVFLKENPKGYDFHFKRNSIHNNAIDLVLSCVKGNKINKKTLTEIASCSKNVNILLEELTYLTNQNIIHICSYLAPNKGSNFHRYYIFNTSTYEIYEMKNPKIELLEKFELFSAVGCSFGKRLQKKIERTESKQIYTKNYSGVLLRREEYSTMQIK